MSALVTYLKGFFSGDTLFFFVAFVVIFTFAMYAGRARILSFILSFYPATILFNTFPFVEKLTVLTGDKLVSLNQIAIFLIFFIPLNIIINRFIFCASEYEGSSGMFRNFGLSFVALILVVLFSYSTVSFDSLHDFSPVIDGLFSGTANLFYWNLGPIVLLTFL